MKKVVVVLALPGASPNDFSRHELAELTALRAQLDCSKGPAPTAFEHHYAELDRKVRAWPRRVDGETPSAPFQCLAASLSQATGCKVIMGFNEFCTPGLDEALDQAVAEGAEAAIVVPLMLEVSGQHAEVDIPTTIQRAKRRQPEIAFHYAWPFQPYEIADFLTTHIAQSVWNTR